MKRIIDRAMITLRQPTTRCPPVRHNRNVALGSAKVSTMRIYEYISQRKVDMLYSQIHREGEKKLSGEIKGGIPGIVEVKGGFNQVIREPSLTDKVVAVEKEILADELAGPLEDDSKPWVLETMDFYWGPSSSTADSTPGVVVWFGGIRNDRVLMLGGSAKHLIGRNGDNEQPNIGSPESIERPGCAPSHNA